MITVDDVRRTTATLPRSYEAVVRDSIRFRVGRLVYAAFSRDETVMGVAFPKEERAAMVAAEPDKFALPRQSEMRFNWILVRLDAIGHDELRELLIDGWRMCVPKSVGATVS
ncbi:MmcQ/YjbR family DNA-binding protein [Mycobacterium neumannii]|uniref:MmcQ/YjbR family DNA-binding protein n=1 Tax=Mycobacterium neumannii TaxID=2048551 RepID=UPI003AB8EBE4